jgi:hypothetical protein
MLNGFRGAIAAGAIFRVQRMVKPKKLFVLTERIFQISK